MTWEWHLVVAGHLRRLQPHGRADGAQVRALAGQAEMLSAVHGKRGPVAFVRKTPAGYGTARMLATLSEDHSPAAAAFEDRASAEEWLEQISSAAGRLNVRSRSENDPPSSVY